MTPDFTLIWPLSCLKDGVHLSPPAPPEPAQIDLLTPWTRPH